MNIEPILVLKDNYAYLLHDEATSTTAVVDPSEAEPVISAADEHGYAVNAILVTHHHTDHIGGISALSRRFGIDRIICPTGDEDRVPGVTETVKDGSVLTLGSLTVQVHHTPAHTMNHVCYHLPAHKALFTGDFLFVAGCGRFFEGTARDFLKGARTVLALPGDTRMYCGHEYTCGGLKFCASIEPGNAAIQKKLVWAESRRREGIPTVPSLLAEEFETNVFRRFQRPELRSELRQRFSDYEDDPEWIVSRVRELRNTFSS